MKITDALLAEHAVIYALLDHVERGTPATAGEARTEAALLAAAIATHAHLEDELLFVEVEPQLGAGSGPLAVMRAEHEEIEGTLARLEVAGDLDEARRLLRHVCEVARGHFAKEEGVLFPLAQQLLTEGELERAGERWAGARLAGSGAGAQV